MKVLVTGGAGFIGSHVVDLLVARGDEVRVLDCLHPLAHDEPPAYLNSGAEYLFEDVRDERAVASAVGGVDAVCHQAAVVGMGVDFGDVAEYASINDGGTATLLKALWKTGFCGPLVLAGSMVVYGEGRYRCADHGVVTPAPRSPADLAAGRFDPACSRCEGSLEPEEIPEDSPLDPKSVYAATKLHQEHLCAVFARESGSRFAALRYHNVYGSRMPFDTPYAGVASIFRTALERREAPQVFEDGAQMRDFVHVTDVARANVLALTSTGASGPFNVSSGNPTTLLEMADCMCDASRTGLRPEITGQFRLSDVRHVFASPDRAHRELGFRAQVGFREGMCAFLEEPLRAARDTEGTAPRRSLR